MPEYIHSDGTRVPMPSWAPDGLRRGQKSAVEKIVSAFQSGSQVVVFEAPTGAGKTLVSYTVARVLGRGVLYVPPSIHLQEQFLRDFPDAKLLKGRSNYGSPEKPWVKCSDCQGLLCQNKASCSYEHDKREFLSALRSGGLVVTNQAYWIRAARHTQLLKNPPPKGSLFTQPLTVFDEGEEVERALYGWAETTISGSRILEHDLPDPPARDMQARWPAWLRDGEIRGSGTRRRKRPAVLDVLRKSRTRIRKERADEIPGSPRHVELTREISWITSLLSDAEKTIKDDWIYSLDRKTGTVTLKPVVVRQEGSWFWPAAIPALISSATIVGPEQLADDLGLRKTPWSFVSVDSDWDRFRAPVFRFQFHRTTQDGDRVLLGVSRKKRSSPWEDQECWPHLVGSLSWVLARHPGYRTLVHTASHGLSWALRGFLRDAFPDRSAIVHKGTSSERRDLIHRYLSRPDSILLAAGLTRGIDLPDDACRVNVIAKIPFGYLGDRQIKARMEWIDPETGKSDGWLWYRVWACRELMQALGRSVRSRYDWSWRYILDPNFERLWRHKGLFPQWFRITVRPPGDFWDPITARADR